MVFACDFLGCWGLKRVSKAAGSRGDGPRLCAGRATCERWVSFLVADGTHSTVAVRESRYRSFGVGKDSDARRVGLTFLTAA